MAASVEVRNVLWVLSQSDCSDTVSQNEVHLGFRMRTHTSIQENLKPVQFSLGKCMLCLSEPVEEVKN